MTGTGRLSEVRAVIDALQGLGDEERTRVLDERCAGDPGLRAEVEAMLEAMDTDDGFLEPPVPDAASRAYAELGGTGGLRAEAIPGYRVLGVVGEGGMGVIYEAEQDRPRRRVALKVMRTALPTEELRRRFVLESEVLGRLQHPGIARIYEAGTYGEGGGERPFFAMEFIEGEALTAYAAGAGLDTASRVRLLIRICEALEHAHQKGVIHRDLKPANILVGADGLPKILDFGVARTADAESPFTVVNTSDGQIVGTLAYMSPEQLSGDPGAVDTRSDVYALGVLAYELLAGRRPHDLTEMAFPDAVRAVQRDEPISLGALIRETRGDLSTIVGKAMDKDKERRYQSASLLAADLQRFLSNEPITARPPTTMYRVQKFTSRNPVLVGGLAAVFVVLVAGVIATSATAAWALNAEAEARENAEAAAESAAAANAAKDDAIEQRVIAERNEARVERMNAFLMRDIFQAVSIHDLGPAATLSELVDRAEPTIPTRFSGDEEMMFEAYRMLGIARKHLMRADESIENYTRAIELFEQGTPIDPGRAAHAYLGRSSAYATVGRLDEAETDCRRAVELLVPEGTSDWSAHPRCAGCLGRSHAARGEVSEAIRYFDAALAGWMSMPEASRDRVDIQALQTHHIALLARLGEHERMLEITDALAASSSGDSRLDQTGRAFAGFWASGALRKLGRIEEALGVGLAVVDEMRELAGEGSAEHASAIRNAGSLFAELERREEAAAAFEDSLRMFVAIYGAHHYEIERHTNNYAVWLERWGWIDRYREVRARGLLLRLYVAGPGEVESVIPIFGLGADLLGSERAWIDALVAEAESLGEDHPKRTRFYAYTALSLEQASQIRPSHGTIEHYYTLARDAIGSAERPDEARRVVLNTAPAFFERIERAETASQWRRALEETVPARDEG